MFSVLLVVQVLLGLAVIGLVLLQQGKGADMGAAFGSGSSGTVFGARGSGSFLSRTTYILAALFFANSVLLSSPLVLKRGAQATSVTEQVAPEKPAQPTSDLPPSDVPQGPATAPQGSAPVSDLPEMPAATEPAGESAAPATTGEVAPQADIPAATAPVEAPAEAAPTKAPEAKPAKPAAAKPSKTTKTDKPAKPAKAAPTN